MVFKENASQFIATDLMLSIFKIGFDDLLKEVCGPWEVKKKSKGILNWHISIGMSEIIYEDEYNYHLSVNKNRYTKKIKKFNQMSLGNPIYELY